MQKNEETKTPFLPRTLFIIILLIGLLISMCFYFDIIKVFIWQNIIGVLMLLAFIIFSRKDKIVIYVIQLGLVILIAQISWNVELGILTKIFSVSLSFFSIKTN